MSARSSPLPTSSSSDVPLSSSSAELERVWPTAASPMSSDFVSPLATRRRLTRDAPDAPDGRAQKHRRFTVRPITPLAVRIRRNEVEIAANEIVLDFGDGSDDEKKQDDRATSFVSRLQQQQQLNQAGLPRAVRPKEDRQWCELDVPSVTPCLEVLDA